MDRKFSAQLQWMLLSICMGAVISHMTAGIVNVALPGLTETFGAGIGTVQWVTTVYLLVIATLLPMMGKLGDRIGHRTVHNTGYFVFALSSILVALSPNLTVLIVFRTIQAIGAAMFQSTNIAIITLHFPKEQRGRALGFLSTSVAIGAMTGPVVGGFVTEWLNWHWLFLIHVPIALAATVLAQRYIPKAAVKKADKPLDGGGALLFAAFIGSLIYGVSKGNAVGWFSGPIMAVLAVAIVSVVLLVFWEKRQRAPFLPLQALKKPVVSAGMIVSLVAFFTTNTALVAMPFYMSGTLGLTSLQTGYMMVAYPAALALMGPISGNLSDRYGSKLLIVIGMACMGAGSLLIALLDSRLGATGVILLMALIGIGMGFVNSPINNLIMHYIPPAMVGTVGGIIALTRNVGMVFGAAIGLGLMPEPGAAGGISAGSHSMAFIFIISSFVCLACLAMFLNTLRLIRREERANAAKLEGGSSNVL